VQGDSGHCGESNVNLLWARSRPYHAWTFFLPSFSFSLVLDCLGHLDTLDIRLGYGFLDTILYRAYYMYDTMLLFVSCVSCFLAAQCPCRASPHVSLLVTLPCHLAVPPLSLGIKWIPCWRVSLRFTFDSPQVWLLYCITWMCL
jgi:hypothetical protein